MTWPDSVVKSWLQSVFSVLAGVLARDGMSLRASAMHLV